MKRLFILLLICYSTVVFAQDFKFIWFEIQKAFSTFPEKSATYSLSFDRAIASGSDSIYYNFFKIKNQNFISYDCNFWVGPECYKQNFPVWAGAKIEFNNQYAYSFYPNGGDTIHFDFTPNGDTNTFYSDDFQKFSLKLWKFGYHKYTKLFRFCSFLQNSPYWFGWKQYQFTIKWSGNYYWTKYLLGKIFSDWWISICT